MSTSREVPQDDQKPDKPPKPDKKITLTVSTLEGDFSDDYPPKQKLQVVVDKTLRELGLQGDGPWILEYDGRPLTLSETIEDAGLPDGAVLTLNTPEGGGGSHR